MMSGRDMAAHGYERIDIDSMLASALSSEVMPTFAQEDLAATFAVLDTIPQSRESQPSGGGMVQRRRRWRRSALVLAAALAVALAAGGAVAATRLLSMGEGDGGFFAPGKHLPVYDSMEDSALSMSADVGQTVEIGGLQVMLDSISCDRNIANLYLTVRKEGGIDLDAELRSRFGDSAEGGIAWSDIRMLLPDITFEAYGAGEGCSGVVRFLDAYLEDGAIKALMRIIPERLLPDQVDLRLDMSVLTSRYTAATASMTIGLDLSDAHPKEIAPQTVIFQTSQGERRLDIERFTASDLGTVMVLANHTDLSYREDGHPDAYAEPPWALRPSELKIVDDTGAMLTWVDPGDAMGSDPLAAQVIELTGISPEAQSVMMTPMLDLPEGESVATSIIEDYVVDARQLPAELPQSDFGGYELTGIDIANGTAVYRLKSYGWLPFGVHPTLTPVDSSGAQLYIGGCLQRMKQDYRTGELLVACAYYTASDEQIAAAAGWVRSCKAERISEESAAAQTISFS